MSRSQFELELFGKCQLRAPDGRPVHFPTKHCLHVLAILLESAGLAVDRLELASAVWPDADQGAVRNRLRTALAAIRHVLPDGAVLAFERSIALQQGIVQLIGPTSVEAEGQFMQTFDTEWAVSRRLSYRSNAVSRVLRDAVTATLFDDKLALVEAARRVDPLSQEAAEAHVRLLRSQGQGPKAVEVADAYRLKTVRELGVMPELRGEEAKSDPAPLTQAAEWLICRDPVQALSFLAATESYWFGTDVRAALALHERALASTARQSSTRGHVEAQRFYLIAYAGQLGQYRRAADDAYQGAIAADERSTAVRLAAALSYCCLSAGEFEEALRYAVEARDLAALSTSLELKHELQLQLAVIQWHVGQLRQSRITLNNCCREIDECGSPRDRAQIAAFKSNIACEAGRPEVGFEYLEAAKRQFASVGASRNLLWIEHEEAALLARTGNFVAARKKLLKLREVDPEVGGHSLASSTEDALAWVESRLGEVDTAVEALARGYVSRQSLGTVPSVFERRYLRSVRKSVAKRVTDQEYRRIFAKALKNSAVPNFA